MNDLKDIKTIGDAVEFAEANFASAQEGLDELDGAERARAELAAEPVLQRNAPFLSDPIARVRYNTIASRAYPPGAEAEVFKSLDALTPDASYPELGTALAYGREIGLDMDEQLTRYAEGGSKNHGTVMGWVERDQQAILSKMLGTEDKAELEAATSDQQHEAYDRLDSFQMELAKEVGLEVESMFRSREEGEQQLADEGSDLDAEEEQALDVHAAESLQWLADTLRDQGRKLAPEQEEALNDWMFAAMHRVLGDEGIARLERGDYKVLSGVLDNPLDQMDVTRQYLNTAAEERGAPELADTARELWTERAKTYVDQQNALSRKQGLKKGLDLSKDDDMGL